ncbi:MAG: Do family serine endopeptidase [Spirochaetales bacterium]|nr:Do family serine endopeptidase [Spirochaetales bacterium]
MNHKKNLILAIFCMACSVLFADESIINLQEKLRQIADKESKPVVFISTEKTVKQQSYDPFEFFFNNRGGRPTPKEREFKQSALGSGFLYHKKGDEYFIITNSHVVDGMDTVKVTLDDQKEYEAAIVGSDSDVDIAVIKIKTKDNLPLAKIGDSSNIRTADLVMAIGNPYGLSHSVTFGIISAIGRPSPDNTKPGFTNFIQTDAAINPGNSGGPLLNISGEVIGINTMIYSQSGGSVGIGFAIPINIAKNIADQLITIGKSEHGWIGITFRELNEGEAEKLGLKKQQFGMLVMQVEKDGPADKAGIQSGDVLLKIGKQKLSRSHDLTVTVGSAKPGDKLPVTIMRDGKTLEKTIVIGKRSTKSTVADSGNSSKDEEIERFGFVLADDKNGVLVRAVETNSPASHAGFKNGDVITKINSKKVMNVKDVMNILKDINPGDGTYFFVNRDGDTLILMM